MSLLYGSDLNIAGSSVGSRGSSKSNQWFGAGLYSSGTDGIIMVKMILFYIFFDIICYFQSFKILSIETVYIYLSIRTLKEYILSKYLHTFLWFNLNAPFCFCRLVPQGTSFEKMVMRLLWVTVYTPHCPQRALKHQMSRNTRHAKEVTILLFMQSKEDKKGDIFLP